MVFTLPPQLSYPVLDTVRMKLNLLARLKQDEGQTLARFGEARLVKRLNGRIQLLGGSAEDRAAAKEWCSLFLHEATI